MFLGSDGQVLTRKVASTPDDYSRAVLDGIRAGMEELRHSEPGAVTEVGHGFTVATNAIIEQKGRPHRPHHYRGLPRRSRVPSEPYARAFTTSTTKSHPRPGQAAVPPRGRRATQLPWRGPASPSTPLPLTGRSRRWLTAALTRLRSACSTHMPTRPTNSMLPRSWGSGRPDVIQTLSSDLLPGDEGVRAHQHHRHQQLRPSR